MYKVRGFQLWLLDTWEVIRETVAWGEGGAEAVEKSVRQGVSSVSPLLGISMGDWERGATGDEAGHSCILKERILGDSCDRSEAHWSRDPRTASQSTVSGKLLSKGWALAESVEGT